MALIGETSAQTEMNESFKYWLWVLCASLWATVCFIAPDFIDNPIEGWQGIFTQIAYVSACGIGNFFIIYIAGCNKHICAFLLPAYGIGGAFVSFYRYVFHVTVTPMIIDATLHTNPEEALGVISWQLIAWVIINMGIAALLCCVRFKKIHLANSWIHALVVIVLGICYYSFNDRLRNSLNQRYPYNIVYNLNEYRSLKQSISAARSIPPYIATDIPDSITVVVILGEAARADHLQINGYPRETTPRLMTQSNVISYPNIYSEHTHTLASLPYILTRADSINSEYQFTETSFVSILRQEGFSTAWISNQDLGSTFTSFISECDTSIFVNAGKSTYVFSQWLDEDLLSVMDSLEKLPSTRNLYILHTIGSHWYYNNHVPVTQYFFEPITNNRLITNNSLDQIVNSYDNTIRYMDYILDTIIARFQDKNAIVFYQSDHGEALGENDMFLHANDAEPAKHPACIIWYSDKYASTYPDKTRALHHHQQKKYKTDYFFYSVLYAAGIEAEGISPNVNIFSGE